MRFNVGHLVAAFVLCVSVGVFAENVNRLQLPTTRASILSKVLPDEAATLMKVIETGPDETIATELDGLLEKCSHRSRARRSALRPDATQ